MQKTMRLLMPGRVEGQMVDKERAICNYFNMTGNFIQLTMLSGERLAIYNKDRHYFFKQKFGFLSHHLVPFN